MDADVKEKYIKAGKIASHDAFDRKFLGFCDEHGAAFKLVFIFLEFLGVFGDGRRDQVVFDEAFCFPEPEYGNLV